MSIFCPDCHQLILKEVLCTHCGWQQPALHTKPGHPIGKPWHLGVAVSKQPVVLDDRVWYAAPPETKDRAGDLLSVQLSTGRIERFSLADNFHYTAQPLALSLATYRGQIITALRDYALSDARSIKEVSGREPQKGQIVWRIETAARELNSAVIAHGYAYCITSTPDGICAVDLGTEKKIVWHLTRDVKGDIRFCPAVTDHCVAFLSGNFINPMELVAVAPTTGDILWRKPVGQHCLQPLGDHKRIYLPQSDAIVAYDGETGAQLWRYDQARRTSQGMLTAPLTLSNGLLLLAVGGGNRRMPTYELHAIDVESGERRWVFVVPTPGSAHIMVQPAVFSEQVVVFGDRKGHLFAVSLQTGEKMWQAELGSRIQAMPFVAGSILYVPTRNGRLHRLYWPFTDMVQAHPPHYYAKRKEWELAAIAHALAEPANFDMAGMFMQKAGKLDQALAIYRASGDRVGEADVWAQLGRFAEALETLPPDSYGLETVEWFVALGRIDEAVALLETLLSRDENITDDLIIRLNTLRGQPDEHTGSDENVLARLLEDGGIENNPDVLRGLATQDEQQGKWEAARQKYELLQDLLQQARCLSEMGKYRQAAELLSDPNERYRQEAALYFVKAAEQVVVSQYEKRRNEAAGELYELAAEQYALDGNYEAMNACLDLAAKQNNQPRLVLSQYAERKFPFQQERASTITCKLINRGGGPAKNIVIMASGEAIQRPRDDDRIPACEHHLPLPDGGECDLEITLTPEIASRDTEPLRFKLWVTYIDDFDVPGIAGPFAITATVLPSYLSELPPLTSPQIFIARGDQVNMVRGGRSS